MELDEHQIERAWAAPFDRAPSVSLGYLKAMDLKVK